jgi:hypothetical protein
MFGDSSLNLHIDFDNSRAGLSAEDIRKGVEDLLRVANAEAVVTLHGAVVAVRRSVSETDEQGRRDFVIETLRTTGSAWFESDLWPASIWAVATRIQVRPHRLTPMVSAEFSTAEEAVAYCEEQERLARPTPS